MAGDMDALASDIKELRQSTDRLAIALEKRVQPTPATSNTANQTTNITSSGNKPLWFGLWLSTTCCIVMFILGLEQRDKISNMQVQLIDTSRKLDVAQDKLSIVLQWAPNLRDEVNKEMRDKEKK